MGDIITVLLRLFIFIFPLLVAVAVSIFVSRQKFMTGIKNKALKIFLLIVFGILAGLISVPIIVASLASITTFEQASGACFGISCPIGS